MPLSCHEHAGINEQSNDDDNRDGHHTVAWLVQGVVREQCGILGEQVRVGKVRWLLRVFHFDKFDNSDRTGHHRRPRLVQVLV